MAEVGRWEKVTKANGAGWYVDLDAWLCLPATPLQYLERMALANRALGDEIRFHGLYVGPGPHTCRFRISQPHVRGEAPALETLVDTLTLAGFRQIRRSSRIGAYDAMTFRQGKLWLFDVRPTNFKQLGNVVWPIDVIVQRGTPRRRVDTVPLAQ